MSLTSIPDISTALMRPRRPKQYCLQLYIGLDCESICDPPVGQRCAVGSRDLTLYTNCPLLSRPPVNHRSG